MVANCFRIFFLKLIVHVDEFLLNPNLNFPNLASHYNFLKHKILHKDTQRLFVEYAVMVFYNVIA